jgi:hypothetical protein
MKKPTDKHIKTFDRPIRKQLLNSFDQLEEIGLFSPVDRAELYRSMPAGRDLEIIRRSFTSSDSIIRNSLAPSDSMPRRRPPKSDA